jgi:hypothetical protein
MLWFSMLGQHLAHFDVVASLVCAAASKPTVRDRPSAAEFDSLRPRDAGVSTGGADKYHNEARERETEVVRGCPRGRGARSSSVPVHGHRLPPVPRVARVTGKTEKLQRC